MIQRRREAGGERRGEVGAGAAEQGGEGVQGQDGGLCRHVHARGEHEELRRLEERGQDQHQPGKKLREKIVCTLYSLGHLWASQ